MQPDYTNYMMPVNDMPKAVHYARYRAAPTRRQRKHDMLLTFITCANTPRKKKQHRTAPIKPSLMRSLVSLFV